MAQPKLTNDQRLLILQWLAADYSRRVIRSWFSDRGWPEPTDAMFDYYQAKYVGRINELREARRSEALNTGLALVEERVARLKEHADELDAIKWVPDKNGRLWNEAAWRETLGEIAEELGQRKKSVDLSSSEGLAVRVEYVNDWRGSNTPALPASGAATGTAGNAPVQLAGGGSALAQDDDGDGDSGGSSDAG